MAEQTSVVLRRHAPVSGWGQEDAVEVLAKHLRPGHRRGLYCYGDYELWHGSCNAKVRLLHALVCSLTWGEKRRLWRMVLKQGLRDVATWKVGEDDG